MKVKGALVYLIAGLILVIANHQSQPSFNESKASGIYDVLNCVPDAGCMDKASESLLSSKSTKELLAELEKLGKEDNRVLLECHRITHSIGRSTYKLAKNFGEVFQQCDHTCASGCFHGAMERIFSVENPDDFSHIDPKLVKEKVPVVCEEIKSNSFGNPRFQCVHGLGHSLMFFYSYNLTKALETCEVLQSQWDRDSCYGGVLMENIQAADKSKRYLNDNLHFPCNVLEERYKHHCYHEHAARMLEFGLSYEEVGKECEKTGNYSSICVKGLGRYASNDVRQGKSVTVCTNLTLETDRQQCITGLVYALVDSSLDGRYTFPYCDTLPSKYVDFCYRAAISYMTKSLFIVKSTIINDCHKYSSHSGCLDIVNN